MSSRSTCCVGAQGLQHGIETLPRPPEQLAQPMDRDAIMVGGGGYDRRFGTAARAWGSTSPARCSWSSSQALKASRIAALRVEGRCRAVAQRYAQTWVLCTTASTVAQAVAEYAGRMSIEETYRDWHHHWAVRAAVVDMPTEAMVARLIGSVCLAYTVQMHLGQRVSVDPVGQRRRAQWTVTDRVSWFWCGQRLFDDPGYDWTDWLAQQWESPGWPVVTAPAMSALEPTLAEAA